MMLHTEITAFQEPQKHREHEIHTEPFKGIAQHVERLKHIRTTMAELRKTLDTTAGSMLPTPENKKKHGDSQKDNVPAPFLT